MYVYVRIVHVYVQHTCVWYMNVVHMYTCAPVLRKRTTTQPRSNRIDKYPTKSNARYAVLSLWFPQPS